MVKKGGEVCRSCRKQKRAGSLGKKKGVIPQQKDCPESRVYAAAKVVFMFNAHSMNTRDTACYYSKVMP